MSINSPTPDNRERGMTTKSLLAVISSEMERYRAPGMGVVFEEGEEVSEEAIREDSRREGAVKALQDLRGVILKRWPMRKEKK